MIDRYDPERTPDPGKWLELDEGERILLVEEFHRDARIPLPKSARTAHAAIHATVENQLAMPDQAVVRAALVRLMEEGLSRHDAIHAIGSVLAEHLYDLIHPPVDGADINAKYDAALETLTAETWRCG